MMGWGEVDRWAAGRARYGQGKWMAFNRGTAAARVPQVTVLGDAVFSDARGGEAVTGASAGMSHACTRNT
jgi:hypothetical protein